MNASVSWKKVHIMLELDQWFLNFSNLMAHWQDAKMVMAHQQFFDIWQAHYTADGGAHIPQWSYDKMVKKNWTRHWGNHAATAKTHILSFFLPQILACSSHNGVHN